MKTTFNFSLNLESFVDKLIEIFFLDKELYRKYLLILFTMENWINGLTLDISISCEPEPHLVKTRALCTLIEILFSGTLAMIVSF